MLRTPILKLALATLTVAVPAATSRAQTTRPAATTQPFRMRTPSPISSEGSGANKLAATVASPAPVDAGRSRKIERSDGNFTLAVFSVVNSVEA